MPSRLLALLVSALVLVGCAAPPPDPVAPPSTAAPSAGMGEADARHLLARTGFGVADPDAVRAYAALTWEQAVDRLLDGVRTTPVQPLPEWVNEPPMPRAELKAMSLEQRSALRKRAAERRNLIGPWWTAEMLTTDSPLTEHLTLFWHGHFTSEINKVRLPGRMLRQNQLLRREAAGNFARLLEDITFDPAMVAYLDGEKNVKGKPNENYAREVMELFTLGEGHYTETDIKEAARALTGLTVMYATPERVDVRRRRHDDGRKTILGQTGRFGPRDVVRILLEQPRTAEFITGKLWREFVSDTPDPAEIKRLAALFRDGDYELKPLLRALFLSPAFRDAANRGTLVKSPADIVIGTLRLGHKGDLDSKVPEVAFTAMARMGQRLYQPPGVQGWAGGAAWLNTAHLAMRDAFLQRLTRGVDDDMALGEGLSMGHQRDNRPGMRRGVKAGIGALADHLAGQPAPVLAQWLLPLPPQGPSVARWQETMTDETLVRDPLSGLRAVVRDPAFQVK